MFRDLSHKIEVFYEKHERHISSFALIAGFIFDSFTLQRIDLLFENLTIISYLVISGGSIILLNYFKEDPPRRNLFVKAQNFLPLFIQFAFGGLFSGFFIFYTRSATLSSSWLFMLILLGLLVGNEFFRKYYERLTFQVSIYFVAVFSFAIFFVPVILKTMGAVIFVLSGVVSLFFIYMFSLALFQVVPKRYKSHKAELRNTIVSIFVIINILYFSNLIPPIPLALKDASIFYSVERVGENYQAVREKRSWYESLPFFFTETIYVGAGAPLYAFSSIFAPTNLNTVIVHDWQYFDEERDGWVSTTKISFPIRGGRDGGYRGFSRKENLAEGKWRVDVKTLRGQIIGRVRFNVERPTGEIVPENKVL